MDELYKVRFAELNAASSSAKNRA
ncbi:hypothetical protein ACNKHO_15755 [Shigella flexneri]